VSDPAATAYDTSIWENADHNQKCAFIKDTIFGVRVGEPRPSPHLTSRADSWHDTLVQGDVDQTKFTLVVVNSLRGSSGQQGIGCSLEQIIMITDSAPPLTVAHLVRASLRPRRRCAPYASDRSQLGHAFGLSEDTTGAQSIMNPTSPSLTLSPLDRKVARLTAAKITQDQAAVRVYRQGRVRELR
jgi:hypothetical protein